MAEEHPNNNNPFENSKKTNEKQNSGGKPPAEFPLSADLFPTGNSNNNQAENLQSNRIIQDLIQELVKVLGIRAEDERSSNIDGKLHKILGKINILLVTNKELKGQKNQLSSEIEQIVMTYKGQDKNEQDRLVERLIKYLNSVYGTLLKSVITFEKELYNQKNESESFDLKILEEIKNSIPTIQDLENKLNTQHNLYVKSQMDNKEREKTMEDQLKQLQNQFIVLDQANNELTEKLNQKQLEFNEVSKNLENVPSQENVQALEIQLQEKLSAIEAQLTEKGRKVQELELTNGQLKEEIVRLREADEKLLIKDTQIQELEAEVQQKIRSIESTKNELGRLEELNGKVTEYQKAKEDLESELKNKSNTIQSMESKLSEVQDTLSNFNQVVSEKNEILEHMETQESRISEFETERAKMISDSESLSGQIKELKSANTILQDSSATLKSIEEELTQSRTQIETLTTQLSQKNTKIEDLSVDLETQRAEYMKIREEFSKSGDDNSSTINQLNTQVVEKERLIDDLKEEIQGLEKKVEQMVFVEEVEKLQAAIVAKEGQMKSKDEKLAQKMVEIQKYKQDAVDEIELNSQKTKELSETLSEMDGLQDTIREKEDLISKLQSQIGSQQDLSKENAQLSDEFLEATEKIKELIGQKQVLYEQIKNLKDDTSGDKAIIDRLESKIKTLEGSGMKESVELDMLRKKVDDLNTEMRDLLIKASESTGKYSATKEQLDQIYPKLQEAQQQNDKLKEKLNQYGTEFKQAQTKLSKDFAENEGKLKQANKKIAVQQDEISKAKRGMEFRRQIEKLKIEVEEKESISDSLADDVAKANTEILLSKKENRRLNDEIVSLKRRIKIIRREQK
jgi:chromosome segregation ATPase